MHRWVFHFVFIPLPPPPTPHLLAGTTSAVSCASGWHKTQWPIDARGLSPRDHRDVTIRHQGDGRQTMKWRRRQNKFGEMSHTNTRAPIAAPRRKGNTAVNGRAERLLLYYRSHWPTTLLYRSAGLGSIAQRVYFIRQCLVQSMCITIITIFIYIHIYLHCFAWTTVRTRRNIQLYPFSAIYFISTT